MSSEPQQDLIKAAQNENVIALGFTNACKAFAFQLIIQAINKHGGPQAYGSRAAAARDLGMSRELLNYHLRESGFPRSDEKSHKARKTVEELQEKLFSEPRKQPERITAQSANQIIKKLRGGN